MDESAFTAGLHRARTLLDDVVHRPGRTVRDRVGRVRSSGILAVQGGLGAALAWFVAHDLVGHATPFFAPISAVIVLGVSTGQRVRRMFELIFGVAIGIAVGDLLILAIGTGPIQLGLVVTLAMTVALFLGGGGPLVMQSASSAVLVATLAPPTHGVYYTRWVDALIGGLVGFAVHALLLPLNPLSTVRKATRPVLGALAAGLAEVAAALRAGDARAAEAALEHLRATEPALRRFADALTTGRETASVAPVRWRSRGALALYVDAAPHIDHAVRNARVLARRAAAALAAEEKLPPRLADAIDLEAEAVRALHREIERGIEPEQTRERCVEAVREAVRAYAEGVGFSGQVIVAQLRSLAFDLLRASGLDETETHRVARTARKRAEGEAAA